MWSTRGRIQTPAGQPEALITSFLYASVSSSGRWVTGGEEEVGELKWVAEPLEGTWMAVTKWQKTRALRATGEETGAVSNHFLPGQFGPLFCLGHTVSFAHLLSLNLP